MVKTMVTLYLDAENKEAAKKRLKGQGSSLSEAVNKMMEKMLNPPTNEGASS